MGAQTVRAPRVLVAAGLEPYGRVGLLVDLQTLARLGAVGVGVATVLSTQGSSRSVQHPIPAAYLRRQLQLLREASAPQAVKLGVVPNLAILRVLQRELRDLQAPWVLDPITHSSRGLRLSTLRAADFRALAAPHVTLTPNWDELAQLYGGALRGQDEAIRAGQRLLEEGFGGIVIKGGHSKSRGKVVDLVLEDGSVTPLPSGRLVRSSQHRGTGCRFASALAAGLGRGVSLSTAARLAQAEVRRYLRGPG